MRPSQNNSCQRCIRELPSSLLFFAHVVHFSLVQYGRVEHLRVLLRENYIFVIQGFTLLFFVVVWGGVGAEGCFFLLLRNVD